MMKQKKWKKYFKKVLTFFGLWYNTDERKREIKERKGNKMKDLTKTIKGFNVKGLVDDKEYQKMLKEDYRNTVEKNNKVTWMRDPFVGYIQK